MKMKARRKAAHDREQRTAAATRRTRDAAGRTMEPSTDRGDVDIDADGDLALATRGLRGYDE